MIHVLIAGKLIISELWDRLRYLKRGRAPLPLPRSGSRPGCSQARTTSGSGTGGLRLTVVANPPRNQPLTDHCYSYAVEFWFFAAVASGLLSWGHLISNDIVDLIA